jgi:hypothetical protein
MMGAGLGVAMRAICLDDPSVGQLRELDDLHHATRDVRVRTRAQILRWAAEGVAGRADAPRPGKPPEVAARHHERLLERVRRRKTGLGLGRPRHRISSPDPDHAVRKRRSRMFVTG